MNTLSTARKTEHTVDELSPSIVRDNSKCINCRRCIAACNNVQQDRRHRGHPPRLFHLHRLRVRPFARRFALHQLRPVHHRLPGRRAARKEQHQRRLERAQRPGEGRHRAAGARRPRVAGRGIRDADGHRRHRQAGCGAAPSRLRQGVRHRLRRRPDDFRGGHRAARTVSTAAGRCR